MQHDEQQDSPRSLANKARLRKAITVFDDSEPLFTPEAIERMKRLKQALLDGNYDEVFGREFPAEENNAGDPTK
jgi:hypothetical protein